MTDDKLRRRIIAEAARLLCSRDETDCHRAKLKAARRICRGWIKPSELPDDAEVLEEIRRMTRIFEQKTYSGQEPELRSAGDQQEQSLAGNVADDSERAPTAVGTGVDRFQVYRTLLIPLEAVMQDDFYHPEGDLLYHLLQCYVLAKDELPYDEEFLLAALLHDVGTGIDKHNHVEAGLAALDGHITPRTAWLIEHHMDVYQIRDRTIGHRAHLRLRASPDYDDLLRLGVCDRAGRVCGAIVPELDVALDELRDMARLYE